MVKINRKICRGHKFNYKAEQILHGALPEFLKHGYTGTSMDKIADAAGVSKQTLYSHFADKNGLFTALIKYVACEKFQLVWSQPLEGKPEKVLKDLAYRLIEVIKDEEYLNFVRLIVAESGKRPDLAELFLMNVAQPSIWTLTQYLEKNMNNKIQDAEATAMIFVGSLIHLILTQEVLNGKEILPIKAERIIDNLIQLIDR